MVTETAGLAGPADKSNGAVATRNPAGGPSVTVVALTAHMSTRGTTRSSSCTPERAVAASDKNRSVMDEPVDTASGGSSGGAAVPVSRGSRRGAV